MSACASSNTNPNPTIAQPISERVTPTHVEFGPQQAPSPDTQITSAESELASKGFLFSIDVTKIPNANPGSETDKANLIKSTQSIFQTAPEITNFFDPNQRVIIYAIHSYLGGPSSGILGSTDASFILSLSNLENHRNQERTIYIISQDLISRIAQNRPGDKIFSRLTPEQIQKGTLINELFNYLQGSQDISEYIQSMNAESIFNLAFDANKFIAKSIGGDILIYDKSNDSLLTRYSGPEQFFGDLLQTYIAYKQAGAGDQSQIIYEEELAAFASTSRFQPIANQFNKLRSILKSELGIDLAIKIAKAKSEGDINQLFETIKPNLTGEEFKAIQIYLLNSDLSRQ